MQHVAACPPFVAGHLDLLRASIELVRALPDPLPFVAGCHRRSFRPAR
jgi:hypothetical protein